MIRKLTKAVRQFVRVRAKDRCEYCLSHQNFILGRLQIDHIHPVSKGGSNDDGNLCLACEMCNQYKSNQIDGVDFETGHRVTLFNPRNDRWVDHFKWNADGTQIIGLTPIGRVTIKVLRLNNKLAQIVRHHWTSAGWHPPIP